MVVRLILGKNLRLLLGIYTVVILWIQHGYIPGIAHT
jgi:hypothetical protein